MNLFDTRFNKISYVWGITWTWCRISIVQKQVRITLFCENVNLYYHQFKKTKSMFGWVKTYITHTDCGIRTSPVLHIHYLLSSLLLLCFNISCKCSCYTLPRELWYPTNIMVKSFFLSTILILNVISKEGVSN